MENPFEQPVPTVPEEGDCNSWSQSAEVDKLFAALVAFQGEAPNVERTAEGDTGAKKYHYAPLPEIRDVMRPLLAKHGLGVLQLPYESFDRETHHYRVGSVTRLFHCSGQWIQSGPLWCPPVDKQGAPSLKSQAFVSAYTYARRPAYESMLGICASRDDDGMAASGITPEKREKSPSRQTTDASSAITCTQCGKPMALRTGKKGSFFGCTGYPDCKNTIDAGAVPATGNGVPTTQPPADTDKEARRKAWDAVKQIGQKHGLGDTELSLYVEALGRKVAGVPIDEIAAVGHLVPEVAKQWAEMKSFDVNYRSPDGKHFLQLTREQRETVLASARKEPVPF